MALKKLSEVDANNLTVMLVPETREPRRGMFIACLWALLFLFIIDMVIYWVGTGGKMKIKANRNLSPWDISTAPPQFLHANKVKITGRVIENTRTSLEKPRGKWSRKSAKRYHIALRESSFRDN